MDLRLTFDLDVENYDRIRPKYCAELFDDIIKYSQIEKGKKAVEIGCGTGIATWPILQTGCHVHAVEYGKNMAKYAENKFKDYKNFAVTQGKFEDFECEKNSLNLVYSATAFHWVDQEKGYKKIYDMLSPSGAIALFWNRAFVCRDNKKLFDDIQSLYKEYFSPKPENDKNQMIEDDTSHYEKIQNAIKSHRFRDVQLRIYKSTRQFTADEYLQLLHTYSDHISMHEETRQVFMGKMKQAIESSGNIVRINDTIDLYLGRK